MCVPKLKALQVELSEQRKALAHVDALVVQRKRELSEVEGNLTAAAEEHKAALAHELAALGAARARKDAMLREYVETADRLEAASEPQNEWEVCESIKSWRYVYTHTHTNIRMLGADKLGRNTYIHTYIHVRTYINIQVLYIQIYLYI
jgi:hypothetical protein